MPDTPKDPFDVLYRIARPGETQIPPKYALPFDKEYRDTQPINVPDAAVSAYAALGHHVVMHRLAYCPSYIVVSSVNARTPGASAVMASWKQSVVDGVAVTDRRNGNSYLLNVSFSHYEGVVSWFVREHGHEHSVLCFDRKEGVWYVDNYRDDLVVHLDSAGRETVADEGAEAAYLIANHPNAVMMWGE
jgi:hypothetical protein